MNAATLFSQIKNSSKVTIVTPHGNQLTGRAVMFNPQYQCWVLNLGGKHGTPGLASESNVIAVRG